MYKKNTLLTAFRYYFNGSVYFPVISLVFIVGEKRIRSQALVDSGATISIFGEETANSLGIDIETGKRIILGGVGGRIVGYVHAVKVRIAGKEFLCPVVFSHEYLVSFNLLGRETVFEQFKIIFEEKKNLLTLD
ncbi:aspartyl protease family protein [Candidatus Gottesmanbacteria bacterium]|nr:aspartyl protease family protein [Candidatus Gottesmanbacteria bacterium]MBI3443406.1 aspartyl protease family protein [Candidatus Woesebacteria bacterium]